MQKKQNAISEARSLLIRSRLPIVFVGMPASGKTTIARRLSAIMACQFIDTDTEISRKYETSISKIFEQEGEDTFRSMERQTIHEIISSLDSNSKDLNNSSCIISTGAGLFSNQDNAKFLLENAIVIWIDAKIDLLHSRISNSKHSLRPMFTGKASNEIYAKLKDIMTKRQPYYKQSHIRIWTNESCTVDEICYIIINKVHSYLSDNSILNSKNNQSKSVAIKKENNQLHRNSKPYAAKEDQAKMQQQLPETNISHYSIEKCKENKEFLQKSLLQPSLAIANILNSIQWNNDGMIPVIVQEEKTKKVLMLAYGNRDSMQIALTKMVGCYFSRSRNAIWIKGETSGNTQKIKSILLDCDKDSAIFVIKQRGSACHTGKHSCFFNKIV